MSWIQRHAMSHRPWPGWKNEPCSPTMSYSILIVLNPSLCTTFFIASASTSGTPGITTCPRPPWTSDGRMKLAIHLLSETNFDFLTFYMIFGLTGSKVKNVACCFQLISDHLGLTFSLISCAWVAMKPFPIATCFLKIEKSSFALPVCLGFLFRVPFLVLFGLIKTFGFFSTWLQLYHDQTWFPACRFHVSFIFHEHATSSFMEISWSGTSQ